MSNLFTISTDIFNMFPETKIGILVARNIDNSKSSETISKALSAEEEAVRQSVSAESVPTIPKVNDWREAYRLFGCKPSEFRSSVEALLRRVTKGNSLPNISCAVDAYNLVSIKYQLCVGAMDLDNIVGGVALTKAVGTETFRGIGEETTASIKAGEVIYKDQAGDVLCRAWNYRESDKSKVTKESKNIIFVVEGLGSSSMQDIKDALFLLRKMLSSECGGEYSAQLFDINS